MKVSNLTTDSSGLEKYDATLKGSQVDTTPHGLDPMYYDKQFYKSLKEDVVSGYKGQGKLEVFILVSFLPVNLFRII